MFRSDPVGRVVPPRARSQTFWLRTTRVIGDSPVLHVDSRLQLANQLLGRAGAVSNIEFDLDHVEITAPDSVVASWHVAGDHTGEVLFNDEYHFVPSGRHIHVSMTTRVLFKQGRIHQASFDKSDRFDQIRGGSSLPGSSHLGRDCDVLSVEPRDLDRSRCAGSPLGSETQLTQTDDEPIHVESRWPLALVLSMFIALSIVLRLLEPNRVSIGPHWLLPAIEIALLVVLIAADPMHVARRVRWLRPVAISLIGSLVFLAIVTSALLVVDLLRGSHVTESAASLLASGALIWMGNAVTFGLLYWELDSGGPLARYRHERAHPDFAFSQQLNPELAPADWRPRYVDYFVLGITTSTAFSPTDVMPMSAWAKLTMALQSLISLTVLGLVIARAVNVFG